MGHNIFWSLKWPTWRTGGCQWWPLIRSPPGCVRSHGAGAQTLRGFHRWVSYHTRYVCQQLCLMILLLSWCTLGIYWGSLGENNIKQPTFGIIFQLRYVSSLRFSGLNVNFRTGAPGMERMAECEPSNFSCYQMAMDQYLYIPLLMGWTSIYQLFWCELQGYKVLTHCHVKNHQTFAVTKSKASIVWGFLSGRELFTYIYFIFWRSLGRATWGPSWLITRTVCLKILLTYGNFQ